MFNITTLNKTYYWWYFYNKTSHEEEDFHEGIRYKIKMLYSEADPQDRKVECTIHVEIPEDYSGMGQIFNNITPYYSTLLPFLDRSELDQLGYPSKNLYAYRNKFVQENHKYRNNIVLVWYPYDNYLTPSTYKKCHKLARWIADGLLKAGQESET